MWHIQNSTFLLLSSLSTIVPLNGSLQYHFVVEGFPSVQFCHWGLSMIILVLHVSLQYCTVGILNGPCWTILLLNGSLFSGVLILPPGSLQNHFITEWFLAELFCSCIVFCVLFLYCILFLSGSLQYRSAATPISLLGLPFQIMRESKV
jgi:hypothetical protein